MNESDRGYLGWVALLLVATFVPSAATFGAEVAVGVVLFLLTALFVLGFVADKIDSARAARRRRRT